MVKRRKRGMFSPSPYTDKVVKLSQSEEKALILKYQETGDQTIAETLLKARAPWVQSVLSNFPTPGFSDMDSVFEDVMVAVWESLSNYQEGLSSVGTYLWRVIYNAQVSSVKEQKMDAEQCIPELVLDGQIDYTECLENVQRVILHAPQDMMNERARRVAHMVLRGYGIEEIANALPCSKTVAGEVVAALRKYIAWMMVSEGLTAEPLIRDEELYELAMEHEKANVSCWK